MMKSSTKIQEFVLGSLVLQPHCDLSEFELVAKKAIDYEHEHRNSFLFHEPMAQELYKAGGLGVLTPKEFGGPELPVSDLIWVTRTLAYGSASLAATFIGNLLGHSALVLYANEKLKRDVCRSHQSHFSLWSFAMTEAGAGSDLGNIATTARKVPGGFLLSGGKNYITNASFAHHISVFAQTLDENGKAVGISCFYVPGDSKGLRRGNYLEKVGLKRADTGSLIFTDVFVPETHLLGAVGMGLQILTHCLNRSKTLLSAMSAGIADRAFDLSIQRLGENVKYGKPLLEQPAIRHSLAKMKTQMEAAWLLTARAAATWDAGLDAVKESSMAKLFGGAMGVDVTREAMELFGARGYLLENEVTKLMNDAKALEIVEGPSLVQELLIARAIVPKTADKIRNVYTLSRESLKKAA